MVKGGNMIGILNRLMEQIEQHLDAEIEFGQLLEGSGTTVYHVRRMFSSLVGMPLSEYVRRRRMTVAAADLLEGHDLLGLAVRYGYGSAEAFGRAFRTVHGAGPGDVRRDGDPFEANQYSGSA